MFDLVITNGTIVTAEAVARADLGIAGGTIAAIGEQLPGVENRRYGQAGLARSDRRARPPGDARGRVRFQR